MNPETLATMLTLTQDKDPSISEVANWLFHQYHSDLKWFNENAASHPDPDALGEWYDSTKATRAAQVVALVKLRDEGLEAAQEYALEWVQREAMVGMVQQAAEA